MLHRIDAVSSCLAGFVLAATLCAPAVADQLASSGSQVVTDGHSVDRMVTASIKAAPTPAGDTYMVDRSGR